MKKGISINNFKKVSSVILTAALVVSGFFVFNAQAATLEAVDYSTIQDAIDVANPEDTINVAAGEYNEGSLTFNKNGITLIGSGVGETIIITSSNTYGVSVPSGVNDITIKDLTIREDNTYNTATCSGSSSERFHLKITHNSGFTLENVNLEGPGKDNSCIVGLDLNSVQDVVVRNVDISGYSTNGVGVTVSSNLLFEDVTIDSNGYFGSTGWAGISFYTIGGDLGTGNITNVQFLGTNTISNNPMGVYVENIGGDVYITGTDTTTFSGNSVGPLVTTNIGDLSIVDIYAKDVFNVPIRLENAFATSPNSIFVGYWDSVTSAGEAANRPQVDGNPTIFNLIDNEWYVVDGISIQAAINAATEGGTVNVAAGTYDEQVVIGNSLTLLGAKAGQDARTRDTTFGESILDGTNVTPSVGVGAFNIEDGVSDVIIDGFEVRNYQSINPGGGSAVLAYSYDSATQGLSQITIQNNYLHDLGWNGVCVWSNNQVVQEGFVIQFNLIEEAPYAGIELTNVTNSQVLSNKVIAPTVIANDPGDAGVGIEIAVRAQPGITISAGNVLVEENEITGTFAEGSRAAINILSRTYASDSNATLTGVTVRSNTVSADVITAILAVAESRNNGPATISNLQIVDGNTISGFSKSGIVVKDVSSVQVEGNTISTTNHSAATNGIQIGYLDGVPASTGTTGTVNDNQISDCHWSGYDPAQETYEDDWTASGILVIDTESALEISGNEVQNCDVGLDIETDSETIITNNDVHDNSYGFVLWNANPTISYNNIYQNALGGVYRTSQVPLEGILNATKNWWGKASGPGGEGSGAGDAVSANVDYRPWLLAEGGDTFDQTIAIEAGKWALVSANKLLSAVPTITDDGGEGTIVSTLAYSGNTWISVDNTNADVKKPVDAFFVKPTNKAGIGFKYATGIAPNQTSDKELSVGWNLVGTNSANSARDEFSSIQNTATVAGMITLNVPDTYNARKDYGNTAWSTNAERDLNANPITELPIVKNLSEYDGYWVFLNAARTFSKILSE